MQIICWRSLKNDAYCGRHSGKKISLRYLPLSSYVTELGNSNDAQQERQLQFHPAREISENAEYRFMPPVLKHLVHKEWQPLSDKVHEMEMCQPLLVDDDFLGPNIMYFVQKIPEDTADDEKIV